MQHNLSTWSECLFAFFFGCLLFLVLCANGNKGILLFEDNVYFFLIFCVLLFEDTFTSFFIDKES
jgi:hypothetical protein